MQTNLFSIFGLEGTTIADFSIFGLEGTTIADFSIFRLEGRTIVDFLILGLEGRTIADFLILGLEGTTIADFSIFGLEGTSMGGNCGHFFVGIYRESAGNRISGEKGNQQNTTKLGVRVCKARAIPAEEGQPDF